MRNASSAGGSTARQAPHARRRSSTPTLAKFSPPRLYNVHRRERLFALFDARRRHPVVWIAGPPGSGKSTFVASYVESRRLPGIWFQADAGDAEPATFFHYLRMAAKSLGGRRARSAAALPLFTPEYAQDLPAFTRRFLREFFALFPAGSLLVVDNFHEPRGEPDWRHAFAEGLREIPDGLNLAFISREAPPPEMARLVAEQCIAQIEWEALRFTEEEAQAVVAAVKLDPALATAIHRANDGWAAGIVLMREHLAHTHGDPPELLLPEGKEAVFAYFTGEIFGRARPENQRVLLLAALLPTVSAGDAIAISEDPDAPRVLEHVFRRHLFTERRRIGAEPVYQFHALFREFLLAEGRRRLDAAERRAALDRAAGLLVGRGDFDAAAALYIEASAWHALAGLALHAGRSLLAEGRERTLDHWLTALPETIRDADPRLLLAQAQVLLHADPARSKAVLTHAHAGFEAQGDVRGRLLTAATAVECHYFEWADFAPLDGWIEVFGQLLREPPSLGTADALRVRAALLIALLFRQPEHPGIGDTAAELDRLLAAPDADSVPVNDRMNAASILFNYFNWKTKGDSADALIARVEPWLADPQVTAQRRIWWQVHRAFNEQLRGHYARSRRLMEETEALAAEHGLDWVQVEIHHAEVSALVSSGDVDAATAALGKLRAVVNPTRRMDVAYLRLQEAGVLLLQGRAREAASAAQSAVALGRESGLPSLQLPHFLVRHALCRAHLGEIDAAQALLGEAISLASGADRRNFELNAGFLRAHAARTAGAAEEALALLRELLAARRAAAYFGLMRLPKEIVSPLLAMALDHDVEADYTRGLIARHRLPPPSSDIAQWPWPLALRALGEFTLARNGEILTSRGKAQKKPLELLKALLALGGRSVDTSMLTTLLWPDAEGDDAKTSFDSTVYRLRKLLAAEGVLLLADGKLSLNPALVWCDVWAFETALDAGRHEAALSLYRGHFLALEAASSWVLPQRDRLAARMQRAVLAEGERLERVRDWPSARALYERALEMDNLAEPLYRRLMVAQRELGDRAGALSTYRRCRELLSIVLHRRPAAETEALRGSL